VPPELAVGHGDHVPPGQARKAENQPSGNGTDDAAGDDQESQGSSDEGHGNGKGNGKGNGNGHGHAHGG
jgi:hypothetical protein